MVYGGGGITPDYVVTRDKANEFQTLLASRFVFFTFVRDFLAKNPPVDPTSRFPMPCSNDFKQHIQKRGIPSTQKDIDDNRDYLKRRSNRRSSTIASAPPNPSAFCWKADPQVLKALELLPKAKELQNTTKRQVVQQQR